MTTMRNGTPHSPTCDASESCVSVMPSLSPPNSGSASRMMNAVAEQTTRVSKYTPSDWTRPCLTGWETEAVAAALGTEPMPASLEKRPRRMPCMIAAPMVAPAISRNPRAWPTMRPIMSGTSVMLMATTMRATTT